MTDPENFRSEVSVWKLFSLQKFQFVCIFMPLLKKSNEVIKLRPAQKASRLSMHSSCNPEGSVLILQIIK